MKYMNRKERRRMERLFGYKDMYKNLDIKSQSEIRLRKIKAGIEMHLKFIEDNYNRILKEREEREDKMIQNLVDHGYKLEDAHRIVLKNR